jgi:hypothetical protein
VITSPCDGKGGNRALRTDTNNGKGVNPACSRCALRARTTNFAARLSEFEQGATPL